MKEGPWWGRVVAYFCNEKHEHGSAAVFVRALAAFALVKTILLWKVSDHLFPVTAPESTSSIIRKVLFSPLWVARSNPSLFFVTTCGLLVAVIALRPRYVTNTILFWVAVNLFKFQYPVTNGSDYVLILLSLLAIPLGQESFKNSGLNVLSNAAFNTSRLLLQFQVAMIYLISGWDKLLSEVWSSGKAFVYISQLETMPGPFLSNFFRGETVSVVLSWITILFELAFPILIWQKRTRWIILCAGIIFHLVIWAMLSLPDFASLMIISYIILVRRGDLSVVKSSFSKQLP